MTKNERLIVKLKEEEESLPDTNGFGESNHKEQYPAIYAFLETGRKYLDVPDTWDLYQAVMDDIETIYVDYEVGDD